MNTSPLPRPLTRLRNVRASPARVLVGGASLIILIGTILLSLPQASATGQPISFVDALFTATSAVCVTGLNVLDTPKDFSLFGQAVILLLIQVGGLAYMTSATFMMIILGRRMGLKGRLLLQEAVASPTMEGLVRFAVMILKVTAVVEGVVAVILTLRFARDMPFLKAVWFGLFHSISAFNNAGFALFSDSLISYQNDLWITLPVTVAIVAGGIGFIVMSDLVRWWRREVRRVSVHTRLTLWVTFWVALVGAVLTLFLELTEGASLQGHGIVSSAWLAISQSLSARTAGVAFVDIARFSPATLLLFVLLMLIGAGNGSTAGGIKVSTCGVIVASLWTTLRGREQVTMFYRSIPPQVIQKSFFLAFAAIGATVVMTWLILALEGGKMMLSTLFEVASALGTVGLSVGDGLGRSYCATFSDAGKLLITLCMLLGRLGPLSVGLSGYGERQPHYRLPEEKVLIG